MLFFVDTLIAAVAKRRHNQAPPTVKTVFRDRVFTLTIPSGKARQQWLNNRLTFQAVIYPITQFLARFEMGYMLAVQINRFAGLWVAADAGFTVVH